MSDVDTKRGKPTSQIADRHIDAARIRMRPSNNLHLRRGHGSASTPRVGFAPHCECCDSVPPNLQLGHPRVTLSGLPVQIVAVDPSGRAKCRGACKGKIEKGAQQA